MTAQTHSVLKSERTDWKCTTSSHVDHDKYPSFVEGGEWNGSLIRAGSRRFRSLGQPMRCSTGSCVTLVLE